MERGMPQKSHMKLLIYGNECHRQFVY